MSSGTPPHATRDRPYRLLPRFCWAGKHADPCVRVWDDKCLKDGAELMFRARWNGDTSPPTGHYGLSAAREAMETR